MSGSSRPIGTAALSHRAPVCVTYAQPRCKELASHYISPFQPMIYNCIHYDLLHKGFKIHTSVAITTGRVYAV